MIDKVIVSNGSALQSKYGTAVAAIQDAINALIASDAQKGLTTSYIALDDVSSMARYGVTPALVGDEASHKAAFDAVFSAEQPSYAVLLGAPDIVPHISLKNPMYNPSSPMDDPDASVPSDLPYACDIPYSLEPSDFVGPTRVVTRLPDINGVRSERALIAALTHSQQAQPASRDDYASYLGVSAAVWQQSTALSLAAVFGDATTQKNVPPATYNWPNADLQNLSHFFNCHGSDQDSKYYGQFGNQYPVAHDASFFAGRLPAGVVLAAECCYGAQLFNPSATGGQAGIANVYMQDGAHAVWGSTTIAYGPADSNGQADLICQHFWHEILSGSSVGMAALKARQIFSSQSPTLQPSDLKTLAQYIVLGDASVQPVDTGTHSSLRVTSKLASTSIPEQIRSLRLQRRAAVQQDGAIQSLFRRRTAAESTPIDSRIEGLILSSVRKYGIEAPTITTKPVVEPSLMKRIFGSALEESPVNLPQRFHLVYEHLPARERFSPRRILEIGEANGRILTVSEIFTK